MNKELFFGGGVMWHKNGWKMLLVAGVIVLLFISACQGSTTQGTPTPEVEATFIPIVSATGKVLPKQWAMMSIPTAGIIEEILVEEGQTIKEGEAILNLNGADQMQAFVTGAEVGLLSAKQQLNDFYDHQEIYKAETQMSLAEAQTELEEAEKNRGRKEYRRSNDTTLDGLRADVVVAEQAVKDAEEYYSYFEKYQSAENPDRARALSALVAVKKARDKAIYNLNYALGYPDAEEVAEADARVMVAEANLAYYQEELAKLEDGPDPETEALYKAQVTDAEAKLVAAKESLADLQLTAPYDGTISKLYYRVNEWVTPGSPVVMFGNLDAYSIETTDLSEIDVAQVQVGALAKVTYDALPDVVSTAKVIYISPKAEEGSGVNYVVKLELDEIPEGLKWGMTAFVDIELSAE
jgi:multidrug efflux pump subunit AcrA (membrane-fusion protein)